MNREEVRKTIEQRLSEYGRFLDSAVNDGDEFLVAQFSGSYLALDLLIAELGLDDDKDGN